MFKKSDDEYSDEKEIQISRNIEKQLYFKYLLMRFRQSKRDFSESERIEQRIKEIENKKIVYIDDEGWKGWNKILEVLFKKSKATFIPCPLFERNNRRGDKSKGDLLQDIKKWLSTVMDVDCYIIDLRLHDDDFQCKYDELSGHEIAKFIKFDPKFGNQGNQIVVFTASDKVWNLKKEMLN